MRQKADRCRVVLDASAVLAYMQRERGYERVRPEVARAAISTVNLEEVLIKAQRHGKAPGRVAELLEAVGMRVFAHLKEDAFASAEIDGVIAKRASLSLGDRACLALGLRLRLPVLTAERAWESLDLALDIRCIR